ncbi:unnamed protein product [Linum tenue]|uniref:Uncharacterized protein n=1 Tax=Linum tenue TaxID=586396 RepID=A0AAV0J540_9ROSI|nr:unnamed protein product [Linum tenue]
MAASSSSSAAAFLAAGLPVVGLQEISLRRNDQHGVHPYVVQRHHVPSALLQLPFRPRHQNPDQRQAPRLHRPRRRLILRQVHLRRHDQAPTVPRPQPTPVRGHARLRRGARRLRRPDPPVHRRDGRRQGRRQVPLRLPIDDQRRPDVGQRRLDRREHVQRRVRRDGRRDEDGCERED